MGYWKICSVRKLGLGEVSYPPPPSGENFCLIMQSFFRRADWIYVALRVADESIFCVVH